MKKLIALVALALLAVAGTGYAVTCAQDNVPAATLLVPYFRVGGAGLSGVSADIPDTSGADTIVSVTNVSSQNIFIHVTVWNKYSAPVFDFNIPLTGYDVVFWSMRSILNGHLNVNGLTQKKYATTSTTWQDPCGGWFNAVAGPNYGVPTGAYNTTIYDRFSAIDPNDRAAAISFYNDSAFQAGSQVRQYIWSSLDESGDISNWATPGVAGAFVLDKDNYVCDSNKDQAYAGIAGDFSGYVTIDVVNNCSLHNPNEPLYYENDVIATRGWGTAPGANVLIGDVIYKDLKAGDVIANASSVNVMSAVALEFDARLDWNYSKTFYGRYFDSLDAINAGFAAAYSFPGDGREPLGQEYGFRFMQTGPVGTPSTLGTWISVYRSDTYAAVSTIPQANVNLCPWWDYLRGGAKTTSASGFTNPVHGITFAYWDNDEGQLQTGGGQPSQPGGPSSPGTYIYLEAQRLVVTPGATVVGATFLGGWVDLLLPGNIDEQAWVSVQHSGVGSNLLSGGHAAALMNDQFICVPAPASTWTVPTPVVPNTKAVQTF
jgi:hypothetical protein